MAFEWNNIYTPICTLVGVFTGSYFTLRGIKNQIESQEKVNNKKEKLKQFELIDRFLYKLYFKSADLNNQIALFALDCPLDGEVVANRLSPNWIRIKIQTHAPSLSEKLKRIAEICDEQGNCIHGSLSFDGNRNIDHTKTEYAEMSKALLNEMYNLVNSCTDDLSELSKQL